MFGREFTLAGVARMLATDPGSDDLVAVLDYADDRDMIERTTRANGFRFRHDLVRDAVYAMIPTEERPSAHLVAAEWLSSTDADPSVLAEHFERAEVPDRAVPFLLRAADDALNAGSYVRVPQIVARAVADGATGEALGALEIHRAFSCAWLHDWRACQAAATDALALVPRGSPTVSRGGGLHVRVHLPRGWRGGRHPLPLGPRGRAPRRAHGLVRVRRERGHHGAEPRRGDSRGARSSRSSIGTAPSRRWTPRSSCGGRSRTRTSRSPCPATPRSRRSGSRSRSGRSAPSWTVSPASSTAISPLRRRAISETSTRP
ncbi:MAG: hypothetical protein U0414_08860 [Polyangiaceae bacterium]